MGELAVGQKVVHPRYGAGTVVQVRTGGADEDHKLYYVIHIPSKDLQVHLPVDAAGGVELRELVSVLKMDNALNILRSEPVLLPSDYRERRAWVVESMQDGAVGSLAQVIRDLHGLHGRKTLSVLESSVLLDAKRQLAGELALVVGIEFKDAMRRVESALSKGPSA